MSRGRGETGSMIAVAGGVLLLVSLFLAWYKVAGFTVTAWTAFEVWDVVLAALALGVIVSAATDLGWWRGPTHAAGPLVLGLAAVVIVASQLLDHPPSVLHSTVADGGWVGLAGAVLMAAGPLMAESRVTFSVNAGPRGADPVRRRRRPVDAPLAGPGPVPMHRPVARGGGPYPDDTDLGPPRRL